MPSVHFHMFQVLPTWNMFGHISGHAHFLHWKTKKENQRTDQHYITLDHKVVHTGKCLHEKSTKDINYSVCTMLLKVIPKSIMLSSFIPDGFSLWSGLCSFVLDSVILSAVMYLWLGLENSENSDRHFDEIRDK